jgi:hypothetical protein
MCPTSIPATNATTGYSRLDVYKNSLMVCVPVATKAASTAAIRIAAPMVKRLVTC